MSADERKVTPSDSDWMKFWALLGQIGAWQWHGRYVCPGVLDGTGWRIDIEYREKRVHCSGTNAYPPHGSGPDPTTEFRLFCNGVSRLLGGLGFK